MRMDRLTFEGNFCEIARCACMKCPYDTDCSQKQVWERLKQYEDTKRTPEQIEALEAAIMGKAVAQITEFEGLPIARLRELAVADQGGRVIVLPCEVGHAAYWVHNGIITDCRINRIQVNRKGVFLCLKSTKSHGAFRVDTCLGKTVFLTREEAEKALAERERTKE